MTIKVNLQQEKAPKIKTFQVLKPPFVTELGILYLQSVLYTLPVLLGDIYIVSVNTQTDIFMSKKYVQYVHIFRCDRCKQ